jgi:uncharacterized damage-inducible protein DinB
MSDAVLRAHLGRILDWEDAHASFARAIAGLRICQHDILDFCRNPKYVEMAMEDYWPPSAAPPSAKAWSASVAAVRRDRAALKKLAADGKVDLFARIPHGSGQTYLRELLLVADHNAYHVGQLVALRRALGSWSG